MGLRITWSVIAMAVPLALPATAQVRNTVTGKLYEIPFGASGQRLVKAIDGTPVDARNAAELLHGGQK